MNKTLLQKVRSRLSTPDDVWLATRMVLWACCLPALKHMIPLPTLVHLVAGRRANQMAASAATCKHSQSNRDHERLEQIATLARWSCRLTRRSTGGNCLERGLVAYRYLRAARFEPSLVAGFKRGEDGDLRGHTWVVVNGRPVGEPAGSLAGFERTLTFGPDGCVL
jgi:Transglutaminase-like superfamily